MKKRLMLVIWLLLNIALFLFAETVGQKMLPGICIAVLIVNGPYSLLALALWGFVYLIMGKFILPNDLPSTLKVIVDLFLFISIMFVGYWQWFVLLPKFKDRFQKWRTSKKN